MQSIVAICESHLTSSADLLCTTPDLQRQTSSMASEPGAAQAEACSAVSLPNLPLPDLKSSLAQYLSLVKPLVSAEEYAAEEAATAEIGLQTAHEAAVALAAKNKAAGKSYFEDIWKDAYMRPRGGLAVHVNPFFVLEVSHTLALPTRRGSWLGLRPVFLCGMHRINAEPPLYRMTQLPIGTARQQEPLHC